MGAEILRDFLGGHQLKNLTTRDDEFVFKSNELSSRFSKFHPNRKQVLGFKHQ